MDGCVPHTGLPHLDILLQFPSWAVCFSKRNTWSTIWEQHFFSLYEEHWSIYLEYTQPTTLKILPKKVWQQRKPSATSCHLYETGVELWRGQMKEGNTALLIPWTSYMRTNGSKLGFLVLLQENPAGAKWTAWSTLWQEQSNLPVSWGHPIMYSIVYFTLFPWLPK